MSHARHHLNGVRRPDVGPQCPDIPSDDLVPLPENAGSMASPSVP